MIHRMITMVLMATMGALFNGISLAADNDRAIAFSRANANKFRTEVTEIKGITINKTITVTGSLDYIDVMALGLKYNPDSGIATPFSVAQFGNLKFYEKCVPKGYFVGQNAFGVKRTVKREICERFFVSAYPSNWIDLSGKDVKMTATQFRAIQAHGFVVEADFTVKHQDDITVSFSDALNQATIDSPTESRTRVWTINGDFEALRWKLPGAGKFVEVWSKAQTDGRDGE